MTSYKDGFRRGTNYNRRLALANYDPAAELALGLALGRKCEAGEHDEVVAEKNRVTYLPGRGQVPPGAHYCQRCGALIASEDGPAQ